MGRRGRLRGLAIVAAAALACAPPILGQAPVVSDLAAFSPGDGLYRRVLGSVGQGSFGVPLGGGFDMDKDGVSDSAFAAMLANPMSRNNAGSDADQ